MDTNSESTDIKIYKPFRKENIPSVKEEEGTEDSSDSSFVKWENRESSNYSFIPQSKVSAFDVAAYILEKRGEMTTMKLHKLVYYSQAWSLVWDDEPLFNDRIEAWANGPVIRELFAYHIGSYSISKIVVGNPAVLSTKQKQTIDAVLEYYANKPSQWLVELSHMEAPWKNARKGLSPTERGHNEIPQESIVEYYSSL